MGVLTENRKARFNYTILETYEAGIELKGFEVKAVKAGKMNLTGAFGIVRGNEIWLINADIPPYQPGNTPKDYESSRPRRLLLRAAEIRELIGKMKERGLTLLALRAYTKGNLVKIALGLGRGKRGPDKREAIKKRETGREIARTLNA
ncbi:MAG: SsrA-binding protein SmpB [Candidatus Harrisonbacteria bacterium]|nr:SsrA-binding protein SmpB [Candidatus Harrisonbacteria bacterium]